MTITASKKAKGIDALAEAREHYEDGNSCGDAIEKGLESFRTKNGLDTKALTRCLKENKIRAPKIDMDRHGAIGRFRMCAGLMLRRNTSKQGLMIISGKKIAAPGTKKRRRKLKRRTFDVPGTVASENPMPSL